MPPSVDFLLPLWMREHQAHKKFSLTESNVTALSLAELEALATPTSTSTSDTTDTASAPLNSFINQNLPLGYNMNRGTELLRTRFAEAICAPITAWGVQNYLNLNANGATPTTPKNTAPLTASNILVTTGTSGANTLVLDNLLGPGDHVIVHYPTYPALYEVPRRAGAEVTLWRAREENGWVLDWKELEGMIVKGKGKTRMVVVNNPNNPTGAVMPTETLQHIADICTKYNIIFFADEIFRPLFHNAADDSSSSFATATTTGSVSVESDNVSTSSLPPPSIHALERPTPLTITTTSLSKSFSLPGLRIGCIAVSDALLGDHDRPEENLLTRLTGYADYTTIAVSLLDDQVASFALRKDVRNGILKRSAEICKENLDLWEGFVRRCGGRVQWVRPKGAGTAWIRIREKEGGEWVDDEAFADELVKGAGLLIVPGGRCFSDAAAAAAAVGDASAGDGDGHGDDHGDRNNVKAKEQKENEKETEKEKDNDEGKTLFVDPAFKGYFRVAIGNEIEKTRVAIELLEGFLEAE